MKGLDPDLRALQEMRDAVERAKVAHKAIASASQEEVDRLCRAMAQAGAAAAHDLGRLAVDETGIGRVHYKVLKNLFGSEGTWDSIKDERTVGIIKRDERQGVYEVATPVGVVAAIIPTTNPTSTALFKAIIAVKGRNSIVISPHPRAKRCIYETCEVMRRAIERAGGPPDLIVCLSNPTMESTGALMKHRNVSIILATGGSGLVRAAYSSGKPAYGVGPGNVPAYVDRSADLGTAASDITKSQSFDNGTLCSSEQALVLDQPIAQAFLDEMIKRGAHFCSESEVALLSAYCNKGGMMNPDVVGIDPWRVAEGAGFSVPRETTVLLAPQAGVGKEHLLSIEVLCPLLSVHMVNGWKQGCEVATQLLHFGGLGHTMAVHAKDEAVLEAFFLEKPASRIIANGPSSIGAVGFSTNLMPSFSLGCGPQAGNITSDNITARHLLNIKRVGFKRRDWEQIERKAHERAAAMTGAGAPRGSGMDGDPALAGGRARAGSRGAPDPLAGQPSNWMGNPTFGAADQAATSMGGSTMSTSSRPAPPEAVRPAGGMAPKVRAAIKSTPASSYAASPGSAPTFTRPASTELGSQEPSFGGCNRPSASGASQVARPAPAAPSNPVFAQPSGSNVGAYLSVGEIRGIMEHAEEGCPLGPCKGCPHLDVRTGACKA